MNASRIARSGRPLALVAALALILAACSSAGASAPPGSPAASDSPSQPASAPPSTEPLPSDPDGSVTSPSDPGPGGGGDAKLVVPRPGTINPRPVAVERIEPAIDGRHVTVKLTWTSGVEPCYVLDSVDVARDGSDIVVTVLEGSGQQDVMCVEIAQQKSTIADLGELEPGDYTISVTNSDIPPVTITVT